MDLFSISYLVFFRGNHQHIDILTGTELLPVRKKGELQEPDRADLSPAFPGGRPPGCCNIRSISSSTCICIRLFLDLFDRYCHIRRELHLLFQFQRQCISVSPAGIYAAGIARRMIQAALILAFLIGFLRMRFRGIGVERDLICLIFPFFFL